MSNLLHKITEKFLLNEGMNNSPDVMSYIQSIEEVLNLMAPISQRDNRRLEIAKENLKNIRKHNRKMQQKIISLEERLKLLEENE